MTYDILQEEWIPVSDGRNLSLLDCLKEAPKIQKIACTYPIETYSVSRLIIAFLMDALQLKNKDERFQLLEKGEFPMEQILAYIEKCKREGCSFDLFDETHPFMQAGYDPQYDKETKSVANIVPSHPSGNNHVFFEHIPSNQYSISPSEALRSLLTSYVFCFATAQEYPSSVNNKPCVYAMVYGENLFETLILNMVSIRECGNIPYGKPAWRCFDPIVPKKTFANVDMLQALTWQPRRVTLRLDERQQVSRIYICQGLNFKGNGLWRDPHVPYRILKEDDFSSVKPEKGKELWRDIGALTISKVRKQIKAPLVIENLPRKYENYKIFLTGVVTPKPTMALIYAQVSEEMLIPRRILNDEDYADVLRTDIEFVEDCGKRLTDVVKKNCKEWRESASKDGSSLLRITQMNFFAECRKYLFEEYLGELSECETDEAFEQLERNLESRLKDIIIQTIQRTIAHMGYDAKTIIVGAKIRENSMRQYKMLIGKREGE